MIMVFKAYNKDVPYWGIDCESCGFTVRSVRSLDDARFLWDHAGNPNALKPCPFCGSTDVHLVENDRGKSEVSITCKDCNVWVDHMFDAMSKEEAIALWNRRENE